MLRLLAQYTHITQQILYLGGRRGKTDLIALTEDKVTVGNIDLSVTLNDADEKTLAVMISQLTQRHAAQRRVLMQYQLYHLKAAAGKRLDLYDRREL